ncbi:hypothetical protein D9V32_13465 [Mycetocola tolaasinivorans]|uniref:Phage tail protein n=1 Tax=Mycetocola tolaasinivorans TaxID=76635 RepID=A0A3L7A460_9MICO|nr:hypothetical protein [Mycetocola tolaasinivorans]RLP74351.1 hypothetical protein D9V32_13465 [Mycetocola tolaasinivorans]
MTVNADLARIFGGADAVYLAPIGTTVPTTISAPVGAVFEDVGWLHSDGITETLTGSKSEIRGHQKNGVVRSRIESPGTQVKFVALEDKAQTRELRYDVVSAASTSGVRKEVRGPGQKVSPRVCVIDKFDTDDETVKERTIIPRLEIVPDGDRVYSNADISGFGMLGEIIGEYTVFSTDLETPAGS